MLAAVFGLMGVVVGGVLQLITQYLATHTQRRLDRKRKRLLVQMLSQEDRRWRSLGQCAKVIGADDDTTRRLLIEVGARASEGDDDLWGLLSRNPFSA